MNIKKYIIGIFVLILVMTMAACGDSLKPTQNEEQVQENKAMYHKISQEEAKERIDNGVLSIDVREQDEYDSGHIVGAVLSPVGNIGNDIVNIAKDKDTEILIYCRSGNRSRVASDALVALGYTNVYDFGGINTWQYEIEK